MKINIKGPIIENDYKWAYDYYEMESTSPGDVEKAINGAMANEELEVEINSGGGDVYAGSEIYTTLKNYKGNVKVSIVGVAASAASVIAMAGDIVEISPTAQIMIHNVSTVAWGDYRDLNHTAEVIKNYNTSIANAYILKTGIEESELLALMDKETWLTAQQSKEKGFADAIMFDTNNRLAASMLNGSMLPDKVIEKIRNMKIVEKNMKKKKAELELLKLGGDV